MNHSVVMVNTIIHEHLHFRKVSARWVPRQLSDFDRHKRVEGCTELEHFNREGQDFLDCIIICDRTWVNHFTPETKQASKQWKHADSPPPKKFRAIVSAGKLMASVFWDKCGLIHVDFLPHGATINSEYYCCVLSDVHMRLRKKRPGLITKDVLFLQDNARAPTTHHTTCTLQKLSWEVLPNPRYSPDFTPSDFHLFGPLKQFLEGQHFSTDDEVKQAILRWFSHTDKSFYAEAFQALVKRWDKCVNVAGEYVKK